MKEEWIAKEVIAETDTEHKFYYRTLSRLTRCKDCKWSQAMNWMVTEWTYRCRLFDLDNVRENDFCSRAERMTEE